MKRTENGNGATPYEAETLSKNGRDGKGRFAPGNIGGPGRPRGEREYLDAMISRASIARWNKIVDKLLTLAEAGDVQAFNALKGYLIGLPVQRFEVATLSLLAQLDDALKLHDLSLTGVLSAMLAEMRAIPSDDGEPTEDENDNG